MRITREKVEALMQQSWEVGFRAGKKLGEQQYVDDVLKADTARAKAEEAIASKLDIVEGKKSAAE